MLKDSQPSYQWPSCNDLSIVPNIEVNKILEFIDNNIPSFYPYYQSRKDSDRENRISDFLVHHFELCKIEQSGGFFPYRFSKNPTQPHSGKETDVGVFVMTRSQKPIPIIEFEAKRFSETSNNKEYVSGDRGGIERFKRGHHSSHLSVCGMFGYVQSRTSLEWIRKVNEWIDELSRNNIDQSIDWTNEKEQLVKTNSFPKVEKLSSHHTRKQSNDIITLWHYLIELN
nr:hypothetical protein [Bacteroidota bacterium]